MVAKNGAKVAKNGTSTLRPCWKKGKSKKLNWIDYSLPLLNLTTRLSIVLKIFRPNRTSVNTRSCTHWFFFLTISHFVILTIISFFLAVFLYCVHFYLWLLRSVLYCFIAPYTLLYSIVPLLHRQRACNLLRSLGDYIPGSLSSSIYLSIHPKIVPNVIIVIFDPRILLLFFRKTKHPS